MRLFFSHINIYYILFFFLELAPNSKNHASNAIFCITIETTGVSSALLLPTLRTRPEAHKGIHRCCDDNNNNDNDETNAERVAISAPGTPSRRLLARYPLLGKRLPWPARPDERANRSAPPAKQKVRITIHPRFISLSLHENGFS